MPLHDLIDKWIDNDIWLSLCIDTAFKMLLQVLIELEEQSSRDQETAFGLYLSCVESLGPLMQVIGNGVTALTQSRERTS